MEDGKYEEAISEFEWAQGYADAQAKIDECREIIACGGKYEEALRLQQEGRYEEAVAIFTALDGYGESAARIAECEKAILDGKYQAALTLQQAGKYDEAIAAYEALDGYGESAARIAECEKAILDGKYQAALALQQAGKYDEAIAAYKALDGYGESAARIAECEKEIALNAQYQAALGLLEAGRYEEAIAIFGALGDHADAKDKLAECERAILEGRYQAALQLRREGRYDEAAAAFEALGGYSDAAAQAEKTLERKREYEEELAALEAMKEQFRAVGGVVTFGRYEQDNDTGNGPEDIEWTVMDVRDNSVFLVSVYGLDARAYNKTKKDVTWETCTLRGWLNDTFLKAAFTDEEQAAIEVTRVDNSKAQGYVGWNTDGGNDTDDKVYLLSYEEARQYFHKDENKICKATAYAASKTDQLYPGRAGRWLLRSPGPSQDYVARVDEDGTRNTSLVRNADRMIRPVLWLDLDVYFAPPAPEGD